MSDDDIKNGIFPHKCITEGCDRMVEFDDEPWCFTHSPDEGSSIRGWSARLAAGVERKDLEQNKHFVQLHHNIFDTKPE